MAHRTRGVAQHYRKTRRALSFVTGSASAPDAVVGETAVQHGSAACRGAFRGRAVR